MFNVIKLWNKRYLSEKNILKNQVENLQKSLF